MPVTRSDLQKSIEEAKIFLGFTDTDSAENKLLLNRNFKRKVNDGPNSRESWLKMSHSALLLLKECVTLPRGRTEDVLFCEMIEQASFEETNCTIHLILTGLKSICHARLCKVLLKRFPQISKPKKMLDLQLQVNNMSIPHNPKGKGLVVPPIHINVNSLPTSFKLSVVGESGMIFVLFHLEKILSTFLKELPVTIEQCYTFPIRSPASSVSSGSSNASKWPLSDSLKEAMVKKPTILNQSKGETSLIIFTKRSKYQRMQAESNMMKMRCDTEDEETGRKRRKTETVKQEHTRMESKNNEDNLKQFELNEEIPKARENPDPIIALDDSCPLCVLIHVSRNIHLLVGILPVVTTKQCTGDCLRVNDAMEMFVNGFFKLLNDLKTLKVKTMEAFKSNFGFLAE